MRNLIVMITALMIVLTACGQPVGVPPSNGSVQDETQGLIIGSTQVSFSTKLTGYIANDGRIMSIEEAQSKGLVTPQQNPATAPCNGIANASLTKSFFSGLVFARVTAQCTGPGYFSSILPGYYIRASAPNGVTVGTRTTEYLGNNFIAVISEGMPAISGSNYYVIGELTGQYVVGRTVYTVTGYTGGINVFFGG